MEDGISSNPYYDQLKLYCPKRGGAAEGLDEDIDRENIGSLYRSIQFQRGFGLGSVDPFPYDTYGLGFGDSISNLFRMAVPYLKEGLKHLGKKTVAAVANVAQDAIEGRNIPEAAAEHAETAARDIVAKIPTALSATMGDKSKRGQSEPVSLGYDATEERSITRKRKRAPAGRRRVIATGKRRGGRASFPVLDNL